MAQPVDEATAEACGRLRAEIQGILQLADDRWHGFEAHLEAVEDEVLQAHAEELASLLGISAGDLQSRAEGCLRGKVRSRVQRVLLAPLAQKMRLQVGCLAGVEEGGPGSDPPSGHVLDDFLERWEGQVEPLLAATGVEDAKLERRAQRKAKLAGGQRELWKAIATVGGRGCGGPALSAETQERPALWAAARAALEALAGPARRLAAVLDVELSPAATAAAAAAVPAVVARAACDWRFQRCAAEFEQLDVWWQGAKAALQKRESFWEQLMQEEGLFVRRVERGVEALRVAKARYEAAATFGAAPVPGDGAGGNLWPSAQVAELADAVQEMQGWLRPVRDSAAWRVVDAAKVLQRRMRGAGAGREPTAWERVGRREGAGELEAAVVGRSSSSGDPRDPAESALACMKRLDRLTALTGDLRDFAQEQAAPGGLADVLEALLVVATNASEELLVVLDDPTAEGVEGWRRQWAQWGAVVSGASLEAAAQGLNLRPDSALGIEERRARRTRLLHLRGLQVFLEDPAFRSRLVAPIGEAPAAGSLAAEAVPLVLAAGPAAPEPAAQLLVDQPPSASAGLGSVSPRPSGYRYAPPRRAATRRDGGGDAAALAAETVALGGEDVGGRAAAAPTEAPASPAPAAVPPPTPQARPALDGREPPAPPPDDGGGEDPPLPSPRLYLDACSSRPSTSESSVRPATPSWLLPPWPRPETPSAASWTRPETPSTVCDDSDLVAAPRWKFVDGQRVSLKPNASLPGSRLPPLKLGSR